MTGSPSWTLVLFKYFFFLYKGSLCPKIDLEKSDSVQATYLSESKKNFLLSARSTLGKNVGSFVWVHFPNTVYFTHYQFFACVNKGRANLQSWSLPNKYYGKKEFFMQSLKWAQMWCTWQPLCFCLHWCLDWWKVVLFRPCLFTVCLPDRCWHDRKGSLFHSSVQTALNQQHAICWSCSCRNASSPCIIFHKEVHDGKQRSA